jgi:hypothetical protein
MNSQIDYSSKKILELRALCKLRNITGYSTLNKPELIQSNFQEKFKLIRIGGI